MKTQIHFGEFKLNLAYLTTQINAYFGKRKIVNEEHEKVCSLISEALGKPYYDQNGSGKRVWAELNENDVERIKKAADKYNSAS